MGVHLVAVRMSIVNPPAVLGRRRGVTLFSTHPPTDEWIRRRCGLGPAAPAQTAEEAHA